MMRFSSVKASEIDPPKILILDLLSIHPSVEWRTRRQPEKIRKSLLTVWDVRRTKPQGGFLIIFCGRTYQSDPCFSNNIGTDANVVPSQKLRSTNLINRSRHQYLSLILKSGLEAPSSMVTVYP